MPQHELSTKYEVAKPASGAALHEEERAALEQRCRQLEVLVGELLLKNQTLRLQLAVAAKENG